MSNIEWGTHEVILACSNKASGKSKGVLYKKEMVIETPWQAMKDDVL